MLFQFDCFYLFGFYYYYSFFLIILSKMERKSKRIFHFSPVAFGFDFARSDAALFVFSGLSSFLGNEPGERRGNVVPSVADATEIPSRASMFKKNKTNKTKQNSQKMISKKKKSNIASHLYIYTHAPDLNK